MRRDDLAARDAADPVLRRDRFALAGDLVYLDGNSLGPPVRDAAPRVADTMRTWARDHVSAWNSAGWVDLVEDVSRRLAPLLGAAPQQVTVTDSTSVNLFQALVAACRQRPDRPVILIEDEGFPTDRYVSEAVAGLLGNEVRAVPRHDLVNAVGPDTGVVAAAHVDYRSGHRLDGAAVSAAVRKAGAVMVWDLAHSTGALAIDLPSWGAEFAVGCTYKFLNGGPGAPGYLYVSEGIEASATIQGWWGHRDGFAFADRWDPAAGAARFRNGTPPILSLQPLRAALELFGGVDTAALEARAEAMTSLFIDLVDEQLDGRAEVASPADPFARGAQVSLRHPQAYRVMQALIDRGVVGDHRPPDLLRFGLAPLHTRWTDVWDAVATLQDILASDAWQNPEYAAPNKVP